MLDLIAFDADDTLWHNETLYLATQSEFKSLLSKYQPTSVIDERLYETEMGNLEIFGYGIKAFTLSMIETAIQLSDGQIAARDIQTIIDLARNMLETPVELLDGVRDTLDALSDDYDLMLITKGDLLDQETKVARSGLGEVFSSVEIVSHKTPDAYGSILTRHGVQPARFLMVGNSLPSDVLPVVEIGGQAVHIPYHITWAHEEVEEAHDGYYELENISLLPELVHEISNGASG